MDSIPLPDGGAHDGPAGVSRPFLPPSTPSSLQHHHRIAKSSGAASPQHDTAAAPTSTASSPSARARGPQKLAPIAQNERRTLSLQDKSRLAKEYMAKHSIKQVFEALITCAAVERPEDLRSYLIAKMRFLQQHNGIVTWDLLIPAELRPSRRPLPYWMFPYDEDEDRPTPDMYEKAFRFNSNRVLRPIIRAWFDWYKFRIHAKQRLMERLELAAQHSRLTLLRRHLKPWVAYKNKVKEQRRQVIQRMFGKRRDNLVRVAFAAWKDYAQQARLATQYFEAMAKNNQAVCDEMAQESDMLSTLPYKLRIKVFAHLNILDLTRAAMVCRAWHEVAQDPSLWSTVDFYELGRRCTDVVVVSTVRKYSTYMAHVNAKNCSRITTQSLQSLATCRNLQDLNVSHCAGIRDAGIRELTAGCTSLMYLNLSCCDNLSDLALMYISKHSYNLAYLSLACCTRLTDEGAAYVEAEMGCSGLEWLDISACMALSSRGVASFANSCANLKTLLLNDLPELGDHGLKAISKGCPQLRHISLRGCDALTDKGLQCLASCKFLQSIEISENAYITSDGIKGLCGVKGLRHVEIVDCPRVRDFALSALSKHCIRHLNLSGLAATTDAGLRMLSEGVSIRKSLREVFFAGCVRITDNGAFYVANKCAHLSTADLSGCERISDSGVAAMVENPSMRRLYAADCTLITDGLMTGLAQRNHALTHIDLSGCTALTDITVEAIGSCCPQLTHLTLARCPLLSDYGFKQLAYGCKRLVFLNVMYCTQLSNATIQYVAGGCSDLNTLHLFGIESITNSGLDVLVKLARALRRVSLSSSSLVTRDAVLRVSSAHPLLHIHYDTEPPMIVQDTARRPFYEPFGV